MVFPVNALNALRWVDKFHISVVIFCKNEDSNF
jgi:hypothetical protein